MVCELLAVGTELLLGEIANTDAQIISQGLSEHGISVYYHTVCGDNPERLRAALKIAASRADVIITTGGLGPTGDDLTKETIAEFFGKALVMDPDQLARLHARMGGRFTKNNEKQAILPEGSEVLVNDWGTAPGCAFYADGCHVIMLPGPPRECEPMFKERALPYLKKIANTGVILSRYIKIFGIGESEMESKLAYLMDKLENPTAAPYAKQGECEVRVTARAESTKQAEEMLEPVIAEIKSVLGEMVYGVDVPSLEAVVVHGLAEKGLTVSVAESCTGGYVSKRITDIAGASKVFGMGCVTYSNEAKTKLLGVKEETLRQYGAVSEQTALEMARGIRRLSNADIGVSTTGIAGPDGGTAEKPAGLFYVAVSCKQGDFVEQRYRKVLNDRERVRLSASSTALDLVRRKVLL